MYYERYKASLLESVSIQTMLNMRKEGYSNQKIADMLGTTYATVYKYIGPKKKNRKRSDEDN